MIRRKILSHLTTFFLILALFVIPGQVLGAVDTVVDTIYGKLNGYINNDVLIWKGVPYAAPPVRWSSPQEPTPWSGTRDAITPANKCTQLITSTYWQRTFAPEGSEDCLYVDIYRPARQGYKGESLPVYVWIHGGSNNFGSAQQYDGSVIANKSNVVVVVVQYRLGPMGWFYYPPIQTGGVDKLADSGNYGTLDHARALQWIKSNIAAFGGNPDKVLLAGESAGSHNTMNMVISPLGKGLFHRALSESGGMQTVTTVDPDPLNPGRKPGLKQAQEIIEFLIRYKEGVNAATAYNRRLAMEADGTIGSYLRGQSASDFFMSIFMFTGTLPTFCGNEDGTVIPTGGWIPAIRSRNYNKVPIILGANEYESKSFMPLYGKVIKPYFGVPSGPNNWFNLLDLMKGNLSYTVDNILPTLTDKSHYELTGYFGARNWRAKYVDTVAHELSLVQEHVYAYLFQWSGGSSSYPFDFIYGPGHAAEIPFYFGGNEGLFGWGFTSQNEAGRKDLQKAMMAYIANFVQTGNPNATSANRLLKWEEWSTKKDKPKIILFNADDNKALLSMSSEELTIEGVAAELEAALVGYPDNYKAAARYFQFSKPW